MQIISNDSPSRNSLGAQAVLEQVRQGLHAASYQSLRKIRCHLEDHCIELSGTVSSFYMKQVCQSIVAAIVSRIQIDGPSDGDCVVKSINNRIVVISDRGQSALPHAKEA